MHQYLSQQLIFNHQFINLKQYKNLKNMTESRATSSLSLIFGQIFWLYMFLYFQLRKEVISYEF